MERSRNCGSAANALVHLLEGDPGLRELAARLGGHGSEAHAGGLWGSFASLVVAALLARFDAPAVAVAPEARRADALAADLEGLVGRDVVRFPAGDGRGEEAARLAVLDALAGGRRPVVVASTAAALRSLPSPAGFRAGRRRLAPGDPLDPEVLAGLLVGAGYEPSGTVMLPGEFAPRGGILDLFPTNREDPVRIELDGDAIASLRTFDVADQRGRGPLDEVEVYLSDAAPGSAPLADHLPPGGLLAVLEPAPVQAEAAGDEGEGAPAPLELGGYQLRSLFLHTLRGGGSSVDFDVVGHHPFEGELAGLLSGVAEVGSRDVDLFVFCDNPTQIDRLRRVLVDSGADLEWMARRLHLAVGHLAEGFEWKRGRVMAVSYAHLFGRPARARPRGRRRAGPGAPGPFAVPLAAGEPVVHSEHGIAIFRGVQRLERLDYLTLEFAGGTLVYLPVTRADQVERYVGPAGAVPSLSVYGGRAWKERKARVSEALRELARELLEIQAARRQGAGFACPADDPLQRDFEASFPYEETPDQLEAIEEVRADLESDRPMDRLVCGDVGYGKTEVALRASFKMVLAGRQVAVLVPTTVLCQQHYRTFHERMAEYPLVVADLSRFRTRAEQSRTLELLAAGRVDIVVGTHRLLSGDVRFADLGLVILDEEQRFGVEQKEALKRLRRTVDVLTMTATPIPRTLHMAILGARDISSIATPPPSRMAVRTRVVPYDADLVARAIRRELARGGQTFYVHNQVHDLGEVAERLEALVPEARLAVGHGQMAERELERAMSRFYAGEADVLLCTTIIESGIDIPRANTLIVDAADRFGLADLHQLRGRVGRYTEQAYAWFLLPAAGTITPKALQRLRALEEHQDLGAGFALAMRDLEIRGTGNILGAEQHGHIAAVGYDTYCRLLKGAVAAETGERFEDSAAAFPASVDLDVEAFVPLEWAGDEESRLEIYRQVAAAPGRAGIDEVAAGLRDRFGPLPGPVSNLLDLARLAAWASDQGIRRITEVHGRVAITTSDYEALEKALEGKPVVARAIDFENVHLMVPEGTGRTLDLLGKLFL